MADYAAAKYTIGICDRCGFEFKLKELRWEIYDQHRTGYRVCYECFDHDQPQLQLGRMDVSDAIAVRDPRPDPSLQASRRLSAWDPIGGWNSTYGPSDLNNMVMQGKIGRLTVTTT
jgi:hypothetical protein